MKLRAFMSLKFYPGLQSMQLVDNLTKALNDADIENFVMVRDYEKYGDAELPADVPLMAKAASEIEKSDLMIIEFSEKGVGLGMGAGIALGKGVPYFLIAKTGSDISSSIGSTASGIIFYDSFEELSEKLRANPVIAELRKRG